MFDACCRQCYHTVNKLSVVEVQHCLSGVGCCVHSFHLELPKPANRRAPTISELGSTIYNKTLIVVVIVLVLVLVLVVVVVVAVVAVVVVVVALVVVAAVGYGG